MNQFSPAALNDLLRSDQRPFLIDVREPEEHAHFNIGGLLIPLPELMDQVSHIPTAQPVVFYCKMGIRSAIAIQRLEARFGWTHLYNLHGGMDAWRKAFPDAIH